MNEFIIVFRESLEATLIVGIVATFLFKQGHSAGLKAVGQAIIAAIVASGLFAWGLIAIKEALGTSVYEKLFEASMMYLAAAFLIYMIAWMARNANISAELQSKADKALKGSSYVGIFLLVFFAISREGFETALFLFGSSSMDSFSYVGFIAGLLLAVAIGWLIFQQGKRVPLKQFFNASTILLIFFAAGMVAYGTHEMEEYLVKSGTIEEASISRVWNVLEPTAEEPANMAMYNFNEAKGKYYHIFHDKGTVGVFLKGFFGYNSDPNWVELLLWLLTLGGTFTLWRRSAAIAEKKAAKVIPMPDQKIAKTGSHH